MTPTPLFSVVTTSWDDGHPLDLRTAELLAKYDLRGTFYLPRKVEWPVLTTGEIRDLSSRFEIGAHTLDHRPLDRLTDDEVRNQLSGSRRWIEDVTGKACRAFCFPGGKYRMGQLRLLQETGYQAARTTELLSTQFPRHVTGLALIPTTVQVFPHSPLAYAKNTLKRLSLQNLFGIGSLFFGRDWLKLAQNLLEKTLSHGGVFHLWGHSWEIEQEHQWDRLETVLAMMATCRERLASVTNSELCAYAV